jgi:hypothetical protein
MLNGLGCSSCGNTCGTLKGFGAATDYDQITIGGKLYTVNQIIGKTVTAARETKAYSNNKGAGSLVATIKAGQPIGIVYSYARPEQADGRSWLMFESNAGKIYWVPNENVSGSGLKEQGTKTLVEEVKEEQAKKEREEDPFSYYIKKFGIPAILIIGAIVIANGVAKEGIKAAINKKKTSTT